MLLPLSFKHNAAINMHQHVMVLYKKSYCGGDVCAYVPVVKALAMLNARTENS